MAEVFAEITEDDLLKHFRKSVMLEMIPKVFNFGDGLEIRKQEEFEESNFQLLKILKKQLYDSDFEKMEETLAKFIRLEKYCYKGVWHVFGFNFNTNQEILIFNTKMLGIEPILKKAWNVSYRVK
jgi:hypothetical protein